MKKNREEVIAFINTLEGYEGYVQFSYRLIDREKDIFTDKKLHVENEEGFIYEAHFYKDGDSISIHQLNDAWYISHTQLHADEESQEYLSKIENFNYKIKMAQIWREEKDPFCEDMKVKKLQKTVFAGFVQGESI